MNLREKIFAVLDRLLLQNDKVLSVAVAISGGSDSTALSLLALEWGEIHSIQIFLTTVDHGLRVESKIEAENLQQKFQARGVALDILRAENNQRLDNNLQAHARSLRYSLLLDWCKKNKCSNLLLAHTQDDQAETVVMRILRGSGVDGLSAMREVRLWENVSLIRPLLSVSRAELREWLQEQGESWFDDPSNQNNSFKRVEIRNWLQSYPDNDLMRKKLAQSAFYFQKLQDFFSQNTEQLLQKYVQWNDGGFCWIASEFFLMEAEILQHDFLVKIIHKLIPNFAELRAQKIADLIAEMKKILQENSNSAYSMAGLLWYLGKFQGRVGIWCSREIARIENEREISPEISLVWDQRFKCKLSVFDENKCDDKWRITGLNYEILNQILSDDKTVQEVIKKIPKRALLGLPVLKRLEIVESVPHIGYTNSSFSGLFVANWCGNNSHSDEI